MELRGGSLGDVYDMTWAEFCIRSAGYKRSNNNEWRKVRAIAYEVYRSNWASKKKPLSIERYMPLDDEKPEITDVMKARIKEVKEAYLNQKNTNG